MFWKEFPKHKPAEAGWYCCTVEVPRQQRYTMNLYWYPESGRFIDNNRKHVFDVYHVYGYNDETKRHDKRLLAADAGDLVDRTDGVVAWRKIPKAYMKGFIKEVRR